MIYEYLTLLRDSPPEWMFKEIQSVGELAFNFGEENDQREYAVKLSGFSYVGLSVSLVAEIVI